MTDREKRIGANVRPIFGRPLSREERTSFSRGVEYYMERSGLAKLNEITNMSTRLSGRDYSVRITYRN